jgi:putative peptidoglycan lipid II flippase
MCAKLQQEMYVDLQLFEKNYIMNNRFFPFRQFFSISFFTLLSKALGFFREWVRAFFFGITEQADVFFIAYRVPFFFYKVCSEGPLSATLVPFIAHREKDTQKAYDTMRIVSCTMLILQAFFIVLSTIVIYFSSSIVPFLVPGWHNNQAITQAASLIPLLMISVFFMSTSFFLSAVLQGCSIFSAVLMQPILFNILLIVEYGVCWYYALSLHTIALCYVLNATILLCTTWFLFCKRYQLSWSLDTDIIKKSLHLIKKIAMTCFTIGTTEINTLVDQLFASYFQPGTIALLSYSGTIIRAPLSIFGACLSMALLPIFSTTKDDRSALSAYLSNSINLLLLCVVPLSIFMYTTAPFIFYIAYRFSHAECLYAAQFLRCSCLGLFSFCFNRILLNVYYALGLYTIPTYISCAMILLNIILNYFLTIFYNAPGILLSTSCTSIVQSCLLLLFLRHYKIDFNITSDWKNSYRLLHRLLFKQTLR